MSCYGFHILNLKSSPKSDSPVSCKSSSNHDVSMNMSLNTLKPVPLALVLGGSAGAREWRMIILYMSMCEHDAA